MAKILAHIYRQAFDYTLKHNNPKIVEVNPIDDYTTIECCDCDGTGKFELPDGDLMQCVACKGTGKEWINLI